MKATAIKTKWGYKAQFVREGGSTHRATRCYKTREEAIAVAERWIAAIDASNAELHKRRTDAHARAAARASNQGA